MLILAIDSAGTGCSACVYSSGKVLASAHEAMERGQDQRLLPLVLDVMKRTNVEFTALDRIASTRGPGSFTGIRIGLAAARGLGLAAAKPVLGIDRFAIFREQIKTANKNLLVVINSRRKELYCQFYPVAGPAIAPAMMTVEEIEVFLSDKCETIVTGDMPTSGAFTKPVEAEVITCAALAAQADVNDSSFLPRPLYIRAPDVTMKKKSFGVRIASREDAPLLSKLHIENFGGSGWNVKQMQGSLMLETTQGWIAQDGDEPVGFILCQIMPGQSEVLTFCVQSSHRCKGIGEKLLQQAIAVLQARGEAALMLEAAADNLAACTLYEKLGFVKTGCRENYYRRGSMTVDAVLYTWDNAAAVSRTSGDASSAM